MRAGIRQLRVGPVFASMVSTWLQQSGDFDQAYVWTQQCEIGVKVHLLHLPAFMFFRILDDRDVLVSEGTTSLALKKLEHSVRIGARTHADQRPLSGWDKITAFPSARSRNFVDWGNADRLKSKTDYLLLPPADGVRESPKHDPAIRR